MLTKSSIKGNYAYILMDIVQNKKLQELDQMTRIHLSKEKTQNKNGC